MNNNYDQHGTKNIKISTRLAHHIIQCSMIKIYHVEILQHRFPNIYSFSIYCIFTCQGYSTSKSFSALADLY